MSVEELRKGKAAELLVFRELIRRGANVYIPLLDLGIDAVVENKQGMCLRIQVKSTEKEDQAGYFNVCDINDYFEDNLFIVCVDMNMNNSYEKGSPNIWVLSAKEFKKYMVAGCRLPIYERSREHDNKKRDELLQNRYKAWHLLTEGDTTQGVV